MAGSVMDGEDIMQEVLFEAYRKLGQFDVDRPMDPWLFRIAHNRCIDFLRRNQIRRRAERLAAIPDIAHPPEPVGREMDRALERLVINLPPKERACVLLKDVFDYSLEDIAGLVDSTVGGVKSALSRGRSKLASADQPREVRDAPDPELTKLLGLYVELFNRRDWTRVRDLITADARLRITNFFVGKLSDSYFFSYFERMQTPWRFALGRLDGVSIAMELHEVDGAWNAHAATRLDTSGGKIVRMRHYVECPWVFAAGGWHFDAPPPA